MDLTTEVIENLERLEKEATPGPWLNLVGCEDEQGNRIIDDSLLLALRNAAPELLSCAKKWVTLTTSGEKDAYSRVAALEKENASLKAACEFYEETLSKVYDHVTNGKLSKPGYTAQTIISEMDDATTELVERETAELVTKCNRLEDAVEGWKQMVVKLGYTGLVSKVERLEALVREAIKMDDHYPARMKISNCPLCNYDYESWRSRAKAELEGRGKMKPRKPKPLRAPAGNTICRVSEHDGAALVGHEELQTWQLLWLPPSRAKLLRNWLNQYIKWAEGRRK